MYVSAWDGQLFALAKHADGLVRDLLAQSREPDHSAGAFDQCDAEQDETLLLVTQDELVHAKTSEQDAA